MNHQYRTEGNSGAASMGSMTAGMAKNSQFLKESFKIYDEDPASDKHVTNVPFTSKEKELELGMTRPASGYNDIWAAILFIVSIAAVILLFVFSVGSIRFQDGGGPSEPDPSFPHGNDFLVALGLNTIYTMTIAISICVLYMLALYRFPRQMIIGSFVATIAINVALTLYCLTQGALLGGGCLILFTCMELAIMYLWRDRIAFSALLLETCVGILKKYNGVFVAPITGFFFSNGYIAFVALTAIAVSFKLQDSGLLLITIIFLLFSIFWTAQVALNTVHVIIAGVVGTFYFVHETGAPRLRHPTASAAKRALTTSFGSICFGSLFVAVIQLIKALLQYTRQNSRNFVFMCADCLLGLIENLIRYFNKYAFTEVAIYGKPYVEAAKDTWQLVQSSGIDILVNDNILGYVFAIACLVTALVTGVCGFLINGWHSPAWSPAELFFMIITSIFIGLISMSIVAETINSAVSSIIVCYCEDPAALKRTKPELFERFQSSLSRRPIHDVV